MTPPTLQSEPLVVAAGESCKWSRVFSDYPVSLGYRLRYYFAGVDKFQLDGVPNGNGYDFTLGAAQTSDKKAGRFVWRLYAEKDDTSTPPKISERWQVCNGVLDLTPNIATANPGDFQTHEERTLAILVAAVEGRLTADIEDYQVAGKAVKKIPMKELQALRVQYAWAVHRQKNQGQLGAKVGVAFFPPDGTIGAPEPVVLPPFYRYGG